MRLPSHSLPCPSFRVYLVVFAGFLAVGQRLKTFFELRRYLKELHYQELDEGDDLFSSLLAIA